MIRNLQRRARLPRLGIVRLGIKVREGMKEYPKEVEYFVIPSELKKMLGEQPTRIPVLFPSDDPARLLTADYIRYSGRLLTLKCDGERYTELPVAGGEIVGVCQKPEGKPCPCKATAQGRLNVIVLDGPLGIYQVLIGGEQRIADLLMELEIFRRTLGRLTDLVFELERTPQEVQIRKEDGSRMAKTGWPVHVRCHFTAAQALKARGIEPLALPSTAATPADMPEEDEEEVAGTTEEKLGEFDISTAFAAADRLGVTPKAYTLYLQGRYGVDVDNLPVRALAEQRDLFADLADPKVAESVKAAILAGANKAAKQGRLL